MPIMAHAILHANEGLCLHQSQAFVGSLGKVPLLWSGSNGHLEFSEAHLALNAVSKACMSEVCDQQRERWSSAARKMTTK